MSLSRLTTLRALRHPNFRLFFTGQVISMIGTWMQTVAQSWLIYRLTGSSVLLGLVAFASQIPVLLVAPIGGHIADRHSRHRIIILTQALSMVMALMLAWLTLSGSVQIWEVFVLSVLLGIVNAFDMPARQSFFVEMVGKDDMINAIALNSSLMSAARMLGPAIAGILVAKVGEGWCFFINGISYVAVIAGLLMMRLEPFVPHAAEAASPWENIREGFAYVSRTSPIFVLLTCVGVMSFAGLPFTVLMPIFAAEILHTGSQGFGALMSCVGLGSMSGSLLLASRGGLNGLTRWLTIGGFVFPTALCGFAFSKSLPLSCLLLFIAGFALMIQLGSSNTLVQSMAPDRYRGRVMGVYSMMLVGVSPLGAMAAGFEGSRFGAPATIALGALACLVSILIFAVRLPPFTREARKLLDAAQQ